MEKESVKLKRFQPSAAMAFNPKAWQGVEANCYSYALGLRDHGRSAPGQLKNKWLDTDATVTPESLRAGLAADGLVKITLNEELDPKKRHIIVGYYHPRPDFHFYHMHGDGTFSSMWLKERFIDLGSMYIEFPTKQIISRRHWSSLGLKIRNPGADAAWFGCTVALGAYYIPEQGIEYCPRFTE